MPPAASLVQRNSVQPTVAPAVIFATATPAVAALQQATRTVPIVFAQVADPVSAGFVASLAKPGGNMTSNDPNMCYAGSDFL